MFKSHHSTEVLEGSPGEREGGVVESAPQQKDLLEETAGRRKKK
jgi:hypothetical protein